MTHQDIVFQKITMLKLIFDMQLSPSELHAFRGAIGNLAGEDNILFHQHTGSNSFRARYPLIQYYLVEGRPTIIFLNEACSKAHSLLEILPPFLNIYNERRPISGLEYTEEEVLVSVCEEVRFEYEIENWLPLNNGKNYRLYRSYPVGSKQRKEFLKKIFRANILSFGKGIDWHVSGEIQVTDLEILSRKTMLFKPNIWRQAFTVKVRTNVLLPCRIGLGKGASRGFGGIVSCLEI